MSEDERKSSEGGNTKTPSSNQRKNWFFTWNNYNGEQSIKTLIDKFDSICSKYIFQEEIGKNGTPHLQGCIELKNRMRFSEFSLDKQIHWEITKMKENAEIYCSKLNTRAGKTFSKGIILKEELEIITEFEDWQQMIINEISEKPQHRIINWVIDREGGKGKSNLCKYLCIKHDALILCGKGADMKCGIAAWVKMKKNYPKLILIDCPRTFDVNYLSYTGLEEIKNGCFFSPKYESGMVCGNRPHIYIFSNELPDIEKLTDDKWRIIDLDKDVFSDDDELYNSSD